MENSAANSVANITGTADFLIGKPLQSLGWEDNFISEWNSYYQDKAEEKHQDVMEAAARTGKGRTAEIAGEILTFLGEAGIDTILSGATGGALAAAKFGSKGGKITKVIDKTEDLIEYENFKKIIGNDFTYDLDYFEMIKYNEPEKWKILNLDYKRRTDLLAHPEKALPNASIATAKEDKFVKYLFNPKNKDGYAKGKNITEHLGYSKNNWQDMKNEILMKASKYPATYKGSVTQGNKYEQRMILYGLKNNPANVLIGWLVEPDGNLHLTTAFITKKGDFNK